MPELPDVIIYIEALERYVGSAVLEKVRIASPFLLRSVDPPVASITGKPIHSVQRLGKRIVFCFDDELFLVLHLMIAGRLRWKPRGQTIPKKVGLAAFDFTDGTLLLTEASPKKRASLYVVRGQAGLREHDPGGLEVMESSLDAFRGALTQENHTLKRALTSPHLFSGIGNAYSDEILHAAQLSPLKRTRQLTDGEIERLHAKTLATLSQWIDHLRTELGDRFPDKVTAFRKEMAVHGKFRQPCPVCHAPVQRIVYAENEVNYCANCQTGGKLLADRAISRLLRDDWPKTLDEWEMPAGG